MTFWKWSRTANEWNSTMKLSRYLPRLVPTVAAALFLSGVAVLINTVPTTGTVYKWSQTAASNSSADSTINWAEGQAPSTVNDSARAMMAALAKYRDDISGKLVTGGTSTAYTLTSNQVFASLSAMDGAELAFRVNATSGASPTLNVDGLGAKALNAVTGTAIPTSALVSGAIYRANYVNASSEWIVNGNPGALSAPSGTILVASQTTCPTGWTKGSTHNNKALRLVTGTVSSGGSTAFTSIFTARTLVTANLPAYTPAGTVSAPTITANVRSSANIGTGGLTVTPAIASGVNVDGTSTTVASSATPTFTGSAQGGTSTPLDFAVQYVDVVLCVKD